jgi:hypothetical protein
MPCIFLYQWGFSIDIHLGIRAENRQKSKEFRGYRTGVSSSREAASSQSFDAQSECDAQWSTNVACFQTGLFIGQCRRTSRFDFLLSFSFVLVLEYMKHSSTRDKDRIKLRNIFKLIIRNSPNIFIYLVNSLNQFHLETPVFEAPSSQ